MKSNTEAKPKLFIAGITFANSRYRQKVLHLVRAVEDASSLEIFDVESAMVEFQPRVNLTGYSKVMSFGGLNVYEAHQGVRMFDAYDKAAGLHLIMRVFRQLKRRLKEVHSFIRIRSFFSREARDVRLREIFLTSKHLQALQMALDANSDFVLVFEDDAEASNGDIETTVNEIARVLNSSRNQLQYLDLTGHFPLAALFFEKNGSTDFRKDRWRRSIFFANTTAAYLMTASLAELVLSEISVNSKFRNLGIDWCFNRAVQSSDRFKEVECLSTVPGLFSNVSLLTGHSQLKTY